MREEQNARPTDEETTASLTTPFVEAAQEREDPERERRLHELFRIGQMRRDASYRSRGLFDLK